MEGESLAQVLARRKRLTESEAAAVMADAARALADAHRRGIVHRDVKPENIMVVGGWWLVDGGKPVGPSSPTTNHQPPTTGVKLCDFGLARHVLESASLNLTGAGSVVGTPLYSSPEQCSGAAVDVRTDVYALGATLFHLLAGRPPFVADALLAVTHMHVHDPPPPLKRFNPDVSDGICRIIDKALAKHPDDRHADAEAFLLDLERLRRGEAVRVAVHPRLPASDPGKALKYEWTWELEAAPERLWPYVADTERLNRAAGVPAVDFTSEADPAGGARRYGKFQKMGIVNVWREHPFEWVEGRRLGVLREYSRGILKWLASVTELKPRIGGGTTLTHQIRVEPRGVVGRLAAAVEIGARARRSLDRVYRRIDAYLSGKLGRPESTDPFEPAPAMSAAGRRRLDRLLDRLIELGVDPAVVEKLGDFLLLAPPQEAAHPAAGPGRAPRPRPGSADGGLPARRPRRTSGASLGHSLPDMPRSVRRQGRPPGGRRPRTLPRLQPRFQTGLRGVGGDDFPRSPAGPADGVEDILRRRPRPLAARRRAGPHRPRRNRGVGPGARRRGISVAGAAAALRPRLPGAARRGLPALDLHLAPGPTPPSVGVLQSGRQTLTLTNDHPLEVTARVERTAARTDALTAARASTLALFRELFPGQAPAPGRLAGLSALALLVTDLDPAGQLYEQFGDAEAFGVLHDYLEAAGESVRREGGAVVKSVGEGLLASFLDTAAAVRVALELAGRDVSGLRPRVAVHHGPVMAATINDRLDYFGSTVSLTLRLTQRVGGGEVVLTLPAASDPEVAALLRERGLTAEVLPDESAGLLHRIAVPMK